MPTPERILLDTHALLWWQAESDRLSDTARAHIDAASTVFISPISCWEISMLVAKDRIRLDRPTTVWVNDLLADPSIHVAELTPTIAVDAGQLDDFHGDPADRLIYATSRATGGVLISKDRRLHDYSPPVAPVTVIW